MTIIAEFDVGRSIVLFSQAIVVPLYIYIMVRSLYLTRCATNSIVELVHKSRFALAIGVLAATASSAHGMIDLYGHELTPRVILAEVAAFAFILGGLGVLRQRSFRIRPAQTQEDIA